MLSIILSLNTTCFSPFKPHHLILVLLFLISLLFNLLIQISSTTNLSLSGYLELYAISANKEACIFEVLCHQVGRNVRTWNRRFYREFQDWELAAFFSLLAFIQARLPQGVGSDTLSWGLNGNGKFDAHSFYNELQKTPNCIFPWKGIWKAKVPKRVAFFLWTVAHDRILTLDNLMLRGCPSANRHCMCGCSWESVDHLLIHCLVAYSLWVLMLQAFGI